MCRHRMLGVAVATLFFLQVCVAQAAGLFENVNKDTHYGLKADDSDECLDDKVAKAKETETGADRTCVLNSNKVPDDSFDSVSDGNALVDVPNSGIVYATELFGGDGPPKLPSDNMAAVVYTISTLTPIEENLKVTFTLSEGVFASRPKLAISDTDGQFTTLVIDISGAENRDFVTFLVEANASKKLKDGDQLMLAYQLKKIPQLATAGNTVELTAELRNNNSNDIVNPTKTITVATSKQAVTAILRPEDTGIINISIADKRKKFAGSDGAYINKTTAQIGFIKITNFSTDTREIMGSNGKTQFKVGEGTDSGIKAGSTEGGSKLTIKGGQFDASKTLPDGKVYLYLNDTTEIVAEMTDDNAATFQLNNAKLQTLSTGTDIGIRMAVDGLTSINTSENPPKATLTIDFNKDYVTDIDSPSENLRQIHRSGIVCMVYNVPATSIPREKINIRITNDSNVDGAVSGSMYDQDGNFIGSGGALLKEGVFKAGETIYLSAEDLEKKFAVWTERALLVITATLPSLEVLALMRNQQDRGLLTNLSLGATGKSCVARQ